MLRIKLTSIMVDDQTKALAFYTDVLGFQKKMDFPAGEYRWITVASPDRDDIQLSLEPNANPAGKTFQEAIFKQGIPAAAFQVDDLAKEFTRLKGRPVTIRPSSTPPVENATAVRTSRG